MAATMTDFEKQLIYTAFYRHVNMSPREIEQVVGADPDPEPPVASPAPADVAPDAGAPVAADASTPADAAPETPDEAAIVEQELLTEEQRIGRHLIRIKRRRKEELVDEDYVQMRAVVNYIRRYGEKPPTREDRIQEWRYQLMARGFDPIRAEEKRAAEEKAGKEKEN